MENEQQHNGMKDRVLGRIRSGEVMMHSQFYFVLKLVALIVVLLFVLVVSVLLFTFLFFTIRVNFHPPIIHFGARLGFFLVNFFPWGLLVVDIILVAAAEWLLRSFRFAYRSPALYLLFVLLAFALALGLFIDRTGFNDEMLDHANHRLLPAPLNDMYDHAHHPEMDTM